ncbi:MAG TPA: YggT family protein [Vicinamibacteria bacterium]|jgi:YggT family protein|nr:YggT family protein [Vicinamibacteria bacterium]
MFIVFLGNVLIGLGRVLFYFFQFYMIVLLGRAIVSWVSADPRNTIVRFLVQATDPPLRVIRHRLPASLRYFPLDVAFLVLLALVIFAEYAVAQTLMDIGVHLRGPGAI